MRTEEPLKEQSLETVAYRMNQLERTVSEHNHSHFGSGSQSGEIVDGFLRSSDYVEGSSGWMIGGNDNCEFNSGTFRGSLVAGSIHIPDQDTTANSFHTDGDGNSWWGCTETDFNSNNDNANAYILKDGTAKFQSATVSGYFNISSNDIDDVSDGTTYGKVKNTQITAGEIVLSAVSGNLDDVSDGSTYAKVKTTQISAGQITIVRDTTNSRNVTGDNILDTSYHDLDNLSDGSTYGRVKLTQISAGEIVLANVSGDLDDVSDGSTYAKSTPNQNTGGSRAYSKIDASGNFSGAINPSNNAPTSGAGLYLGADYMGYYDGSGWKTYMDSSGNFYLDGSGIDELSWDGSTLTIRGSLHANDINAGTLTGRTVQTASSGQRVELNTTDKSIKFYDSGGNYAGSFSGVSGAMKSDRDIVSSQHISIESDYALRWGGMDYLEGKSADTSALFAHKHIVAETSDLDLGSSSKPWDNAYFDTWCFPNGDVALDYSSSFKARITIYKHLKPNSGAANLNLGDGTDYWNEIFYKYLTDVGCLGWFEDGVELQNGEVVSDIEALKSIKKHPKKKTRYGVPQLDYKTMPKSVYRKPETEDGEDGASLDALVGIMLGAIKELDYELTQLKNENKKLLQKVN